jgi:hypothetical protein
MLCIASIIRVERIKLATNSVSSNQQQLLVTADVPNSLILSIPMIELIRSSETSVLTRAMWRQIPEDLIPHSHCSENLRSCATLKPSSQATCWRISLFGCLRLLVPHIRSYHYHIRCLRIRHSVVAGEKGLIYMGHQ